MVYMKEFVLSLNKKTTTMVFILSNLPPSTKHIFLLTCWILLLANSVYDY